MFIHSRMIYCEPYIFFLKKIPPPVPQVLETDCKPVLFLSKQDRKVFFLNTHLAYSFNFTVVYFCQIKEGIPPPSGGIMGKNWSNRSKTTVRSKRVGPLGSRWGPFLSIFLLNIYSSTACVWSPLFHLYTFHTGLYLPVYKCVVVS